MGVVEECSGTGVVGGVEECGGRCEVCGERGGGVEGYGSSRGV